VSTKIVVNDDEDGNIGYARLKNHQPNDGTPYFNTFIWLDPKITLREEISNASNKEYITDWF